MNMIGLTLLLLLSALCCCGLGAVVLLRGPAHPANRAFAGLTLLLALWALGVLMIVHATTSDAALMWLRITFIVSALLPAGLYHFVSLFPRNRFEGSRELLALLYLCGGVSILGAFSPLYIYGISTFPDAPPHVRYGPIFIVFSTGLIIATLFSFGNLVRKLGTSTGIERRQIEHVILGTFVSTGLAIATNILAPMLGIDSTQPYGPVFMVVMAAFFALAMVRYHLMEIPVILSRTTVYAVITAFIVLTFWGAVSIVHLFMSEGGRTQGVLPTVIAALVIALFVQPLKERLQLLLERTLLKRHYDIHKLLARVGQHASQTTQFEQRMRMICHDLQRTLGIPHVAVYLADDQDADSLVLEYSSLNLPKGARSPGYGALLDYLRERVKPLSADSLRRRPATPERGALQDALNHLGASLVVPLPTASGVVGVLVLGEKVTQEPFSPDDMTVFAALAGPLGTAIENGRLYRKLEEANHYRASILREMRGGVIAIDPQGRIVTVNSFATELLGPIELGISFHALPLPIARVFEVTLLQSTGIHDIEVTLTRPDGASAPIAMSSSLLTGPDHEPNGALVMLYDLTQVKRLEQNVQRAHRLSSIGTLAAGMAHEIKNPLVSIKTFTQLLLSRYNDPEFRSTFVDIVPQEINRIDSIVSRLLDFARAKPINFAPRDLRGIIEGVLMLVENQTRKAGIRVETSYPDDALEVYGDEQQLHQIFLNLVLNAIDSMQEVEGGLLRVTAIYGKMPLQRGGLLPAVDVDCIRVHIEDTGCGIPPEHIERVFTPFYTTKETGTGLGLSIVHGIVAEHGGEIDVTSVLRRGTEFTVTLPLARSMTSVGER